MLLKEALKVSRVVLYSQNVGSNSHQALQDKTMQGLIQSMRPAVLSLFCLAKASYLISLINVNI
jgi:hypothetical protein